MDCTVALKNDVFNDLSSCERQIVFILLAADQA
jgi:hypothetical protein